MWHVVGSTVENMDKGGYMQHQASKQAAHDGRM